MPKPKIDIKELYAIIGAFFEVAETIPQSQQSIQLLLQVKEIANKAWQRIDYTGLQHVYGDLNEQVRLFGLVYQLAYLIKIKQVATNPTVYTKLETKLNNTALRLQKKKVLSYEESEFLTAWHS